MVLAKKSHAAHQQILSALLGELASIRQLVHIGVVSQEVRRSLLRLALL